MDAPSRHSRLAEFLIEAALCAGAFAATWFVLGAAVGAR
jgi:hypothetical protein